MGTSPPAVIFFSPGLHEPGGCATHGRRLAEELVAEGAYVLAIAYASTESSPRLKRTGRLTVLEIPGFKRRLGGALYVLAAGLVGLLFTRQRYVIALQLGSPALVGGLCARLWRRPIAILSTISGETSEVRNTMESRWRFIHRSNIRSATLRVAQTAQAAAEFEYVAPGARTEVVPNPAPPPHRARLKGTPTVAFTGRLSKQKGLDCLLEAWKHVQAGTPDARLTLVGEGGDFDSVEDSLRQTVARDPGLRQSVSFAGWVPDVVPLLLASDVFVLPSHSEGLSNALLEASACGRVIVASAIPSHREFLGTDYPFLAEPDDPEALADALERSFLIGPERTAAMRAVAARYDAFRHVPAGKRLLALLDDERSPRS